MLKFKIIPIIILLSLTSPMFAQRVSPSFSKHVISDTLKWTKKMFSSDIDLDNDLDIVVVASNTSSDTANVTWYENNGNENFTAHIVSDSFYTARSVWLADVVGNDGYPDIIVGGSGAEPLSVFINDGTPQSGDWILRTIGDTDSTIYSINAIDFNHDNIIDIVAAYSNQDSDDGGDKIRYFMNNGDTTFTIDTLIQSYEGACSVFIDDFNQDGEWDILTAAFGEIPAYGTDDDISWWDNDGSENFTQNSLQIPTEFRSPFFVSSIDINSDGYPDILGAAYIGSLSNYGTLSWWENDKAGGFGEEQILRSGFRFSRSIHGADMDGDGDVDVVAAADQSNLIIWLENDGIQNFTSRTIINNFQYAYFSLPIDLDGDGDIDVLGSAQDDFEVSWWENKQDEDSLVASTDFVVFWGENIAIDYSGSSEDSITVFYNAGKVPDRNALDTGIDHLATNGYYTITSQNTGYSATVDFYYGTGSVNEWTNVNNPSDLVICLWDGTQWIEAGTGQDINETYNRITVSGISDEFKPFSKWTIGSKSSDNALPVSLTLFSAIALKNSILLEWETQSEHNNLGFEIWRSNTEKNDFKLLADYKNVEDLKGQGSSSENIFYSYEDIDIVNNVKYVYRLYQVDFNRSKILLAESENVMIRDVENLIPNQLVLYQNYPNPFNPQTTIKFGIPENSSSENREYRIFIYDILGRLVTQMNFGQLKAGYHTISWDGTSIRGQQVSSGYYNLILTDGYVKQTKKMLILR